MRCFVAAWPDPPTRVALAALSDDVRQRTEHRRATRVDDLHLTLAFVGDVGDDVAVAVADPIAKLPVKPFAWQLDTLGFFQQAGVVWVGGAVEAAEPLNELAVRARAVLDGMNVAYDRRPLAPHVTLLRGVKRFDSAKVGPIYWPIDSIALYRSAPSGQHSRYTRVTR